MTRSMGMGYRLGKFGIFLACAFGLLVVGFFLLVKKFEMLTVLLVNGAGTGSRVLGMGGGGGVVVDADDDVDDDNFGCL